MGKRVELENKLHTFKTKFDEFNPDVDGNDLILKYLQELQTLELTVELLEITKIGISLNKFRKTISDENTAKLAKDIVKKWKQLLPIKTDDNIISIENESQKEDEERMKREKDEQEKKEKEEQEKIIKVRNHCKSLLFEALSSNDSIPASCQIDSKKLADTIEEAIFDHYKETSQKYRSQVHSRQYNIKKNLTLQENIILGNITADEIAVMTHDDMANDDL